MLINTTVFKLFSKYTHNKIRWNAPIKPQQRQMRGSHADFARRLILAYRINTRFELPGTEGHYDSVVGMDSSKIRTIIRKIGRWTYADFTENVHPSCSFWLETRSYLRVWSLPMQRKALQRFSMIAIILIRCEKKLLNIEKIFEVPWLSSASRVTKNERPFCIQIQKLYKNVNFCEIQ